VTNDEDMADAEICPSCGAPRENLAEAKCSYCGVRLHVQGPTPFHQPYLRTLVRLYRDYTWKDYHAWYIIGAVWVAAFIQPCLFRSRFETFISRATAPNTSSAKEGTAPAQPEPTRFADPIASLARSGRDSDMLLTTEKKELALVNARTAELRWKSEPLLEHPDEKSVLLSEDAAYVRDSNGLVAVSLANGRTIWETSFAAGVAWRMLFKSTILVLQNDGKLLALDSSTGSPAWGEQLESRPRKLSWVGGEVLVPRVEKRKRRKLHTVDLVDAASGKVNRTLHIECRNPASQSVETPDIYAKFLFSEDGKEMYVVYGSFDGCIERWNLSEGRIAWQNRSREGLSPQTSFLLTDLALLAFGGSQVRSFARPDGARHVLLADKDHEFKPLVGQNGVVALFATPNWDSHHPALWGVDAETGKRLWSAALPEMDAFGIRENPRENGVAMTKYGIAVVQVVGDRKIGVDLLNLKTGVSPGRTIVSMESTPGWFADFFSNLRIAADGERAWFKARGNLCSLDLATGKLEYHFH